MIGGDITWKLIFEETIEMRVALGLAVIVFTSWTAVGQCLWTAGTGGIYYDGNVGIGAVATPSLRLHLRGSETNVGILLENTGGKEWVVYSTAATSPLAANALVFREGTGNANVMALLPNGNVGIGTTLPSARLDVAGDAKFSGTVTGGNIAAKYQDIAEWVPATDGLAPGTVVVVERTLQNHVSRSQRAYDTRVAGVISAQPGLALGESGAGKELVATTGRVRVLADATLHPITPGDLLSTSDSPGHAMKSMPLAIGDAEFHRPGTIIGKALEPLASGKGEILVLLSLQ